MGASELGNGAPPFFFYGTLIDRDILQAVIGRRVTPAACRAAVVEGFRRVYREGASYPILVAGAGDRVDGILVFGLTNREVTRLVAFEGDDYAIASIAVRPVRGGAIDARTFLPRPGVPGSDRVWVLDAWRRRQKQRYLGRLRDVGPPPSVTAAVSCQGSRKEHPRRGGGGRPLPPRPW